MRHRSESNPGARRAAALLLAAGLVLPGSLHAQKRSAEEVAKDVRATEAELQRLRLQSTSVLDELAAAEAAVKAVEDDATRAEDEARRAKERLERAVREEAEAREILVAELTALAPRLRARYELGRQTRTSLIMGARSVGEALWRKRMLDRLLEGDLQLVAGARAALTRLEARRAELEQARRDLTMRLGLALERRAQARRRKEALSSLHDALMAERGLRERTLAELYRVQEELSRFVDTLKPESHLGGLAPWRGRLSFPAKGHMEVGFGKVLNPKFNTVTFQKGIDIRAPEGTEVLAVAPGKVVHAGPFRGYGNLVILDHGDGYHTLYAHLASVPKAVGDELERGAQVGTVGDTGSLKGAYLYFEIREKGKPVDPRDWLGAAP